MKQVYAYVVTQTLNAFDFEVHSRPGEQTVASTSAGVYRCLFRSPMCVFCKFEFML